MAREAEAVLELVRRETEMMVLPNERLLDFDGEGLDERPGVGVELNSDIGLALGLGVEGAGGVPSRDREVEFKLCSLRDDGIAGEASAREFDEGQLVWSSVSTVSLDFLLLYFLRYLSPSIWSD